MPDIGKTGILIEPENETQRKVFLLMTMRILGMSFIVLVDLAVFRQEVTLTNLPRWRQYLQLEFHSV